MPRKMKVTEVENPIQVARRTMWEAFESDPGFKEGYRANVAMLMYDELHERGYKPKIRFKDRNEIADRLLKLLFRPW